MGTNRQEREEKEMEEMKRKELETLIIDLSDDDLMSLVTDIDCYDGRFEFLRLYDLEELAMDIYDNTWSLIQRIFYGDVENIYEPVRYNGYGNLENCTYEQAAKEAREYYLDNIIDGIIGNYNHLWLPDDIQEWVDENL